MRGQKPFEMLAGLLAAVLLVRKKWGKQQCACWVRSKSSLLSLFLAAEAHLGSRFSSPGTSARRVGWERSSAVADEHRQRFGALHHATHCSSYGGLLPQEHWHSLGQALCPTSLGWIAPTLIFLSVFRELLAASSSATLQQQQTQLKKTGLDKLFLFLAGITCPPDSPQLLGQ